MTFGMMSRACVCVVQRQAQRQILTEEQRPEALQTLLHSYDQMLQYLLLLVKYKC